MKQVRITVLRKQLYKDIAREYLTDYPDVECDAFREGDRFLYTGGAEMPEGFCPWAWIDIYTASPPSLREEATLPGRSGRGSTWSAVPTGCGR